MHSMTGYGRGRVEREGREMTVELKSVNHRFLDLNLRLPRGLLFLEDSLRRAIAAKLSRGHVDVFVTYRNGRSDSRSVSVDITLIKAYIAAYDTITSMVEIPDDRTLSRILSLPDVLDVHEKEDDDAIVTTLCMEALDTALSALCAMRAEEGASLNGDISIKINQLEELARQIGQRAPLVVSEYKEKLENRVRELLGEAPDPWRLAQEIAFLSERASIDEELVRLSSHIGQLRRTPLTGGAIGRTLDFLVQECNREINTIGSKASDLEIGRLVIAAKAEIEKIREQVQNIE